MRRCKTTGVLLAWMAMLLPAATMAQATGDGEGTVVFSRDDNFSGKAIRFNLEQDGRPIGQLLAGSTVEVSLPPGSYTFSVQSPSLDGQDFVVIDVKAGWTYHVEGEVRMGWPAGRAKFKSVSETPGPSSATISPGPAAPEKPLAGPALGSTAPQPAAASSQASRSAEEMGRIGLRNFTGQWNLAMWSLAADGSRLEGRGSATGALDGDGNVRIDVTEFAAAAFPEATGGGQINIRHVPERGFTLESRFQYSGELLRFSGQYEAETGRYIFYQFGGSGGETATGIPRSSVRLEIRTTDIGTWVADTYTSVEGQSLLVQSYTFTR